MKKERISVNTTIDEKMYTDIRIIALKLNKRANDLIEEGMQYIIKKYADNLGEKKEGP